MVLWQWGMRVIKESLSEFWKMGKRQHVKSQGGMFQVEVSTDTKVLVPACQTHLIKIPVTSWISPLTLFQPLWPPHCSLNILDTPQSQGLCIAYCFFWEYSVPTYLPGLFPHHLQVSNVTFSLRPSLATLLKIANPLLSTSDTLPQLYFFSLSPDSHPTYCVHWCVLFTVCVPSLKCKLPQGKDLCTFCSLLYLQCQGQCLAHRRCLINMFRASGWLWVWKSLVCLGNRRPVHATGWADGGGQERRLERWAEGRHVGLVGHRKAGGFYPKHNRRPSKGFKQRRDIIQPENFIYFLNFLFFFTVFFFFGFTMRLVGS